MDFSEAFNLLKADKAVRRSKWKPRQYLYLYHPLPDSGFRYTFFALYMGNSREGSVPWTPNRCDLLEEDWEVL